MKKIIAVLISVVMLFSMLPMSAFAATGVRISAQSISVLQGTTTAKVVISVPNNSGIAYLSFKVDYDKNNLTLASVSLLNSNIAGDIFESNIQANPYPVIAYNTSSNKTSTGNLITLNFTLAANCPVNKYDIKITDVQAYTIQEQTVPFTTVDGAITVYQRQITGVSLADTLYTYDGTEKTALPVKGTLPQNATVQYTNNKQTNAGNYDVTATVSAPGYANLVLNSKLMIRSKNLTITGLTATSKTYDGTNKAIITGGTLNGVINGDDVSVDMPAEGSFSKATIGSGLVVSFDEIVLKGADIKNYTLGQPTLLRANITAAPITVTADTQAKTVGQSDPELTYSITNGKLFGTDNFTGKLSRKSGEIIGEYAINKGTLALTTNYNLTFVPAKFTISDRPSEPLATVAVTGIDVPYATAVPDLTATSGAGYSASAVTWSPETTAFATNTVYTATVTVTAQPYYMFNESTVFTINGNAPTTIQKTSATKCVLTYTFPATEKLRIMGVTSPENVILTKYYATDSEVIASNELVKKITISSQYGEVTVDAIWALKGTTFNSAVNAQNTFIWSFDATQMDTNSKPTTGEIVVTNKDNTQLENIVITGITKPATNSLPDTVANEGETFTVTAVVWSPVCERYAVDTEYTVKITVQTTTSYTIGDTTKAKINSSDATLTKIDDTHADITLTFPKTVTGGGGGGGGGGGATVTKYTVTVSAGEGGTIKASNSPATEGSSVVIKVTPDEGYKIADVVVNGVSVGAVATYTFKITKDTVVTATFEKTVDDSKQNNKFKDINEDDWYYEPVMKTNKKGYMSGTGNDSFEPDKKTTRAMVATILYRMAGEPEGYKGDNWYGPAKTWAMENDVSDGSDMNGTVTRQQLATLIYRYAKKAGLDMSVSEGVLDQFNDSGSIAGYAKTAMAWCVEKGIIGGSDNLLNPTGDATRAEIATMISRLDSLIGQ